MEERSVSTKFVDHMINFIKEENVPNLAPNELSYPTKGTLSITKEMLKFEKTIAANKYRDEMLQYGREVSSEFHKWDESIAINFSQGESIIDGKVLKDLQRENDLLITIQTGKYDEKA